MSFIKDNLLEVKERMKKAAERSGRNSNEVKLIAVSKTVDVHRIKEAIKAGHQLFGENRVQEARDKIEDIGRDVKWHMIGHLQRNKVKYIFDLFDMVHSVDSIPLAHEIDRIGKKKGKVMDILIQVNISGEETKYGMEAAEMMKIIKEISNYEHISIKGLMTMPPFFNDPEDARPYFIKLRELKDEIEKQEIEGVSIEELSMGMSNDFEIAIEEGATMVRVGTTIFGERQY
ncbi:MAG TPA: YggS family pyridoxal phosphate-dependent enzyme [Nitrospinota bacterium]|nr:YggS family pyridoxal phosphate-dependent enzyme [Nitrospinota bacterium]